MYKIRRIEEEIARVEPTDKIKSPVRLSIGLGVASGGVCEAPMHVGGKRQIGLHECRCVDTLRPFGRLAREKGMMRR